jgi:hypothetical protein
LFVPEEVLLPRKSGGRERWRLGRQAEVPADLRHDVSLGEVGDDAHLAATLGAHEDAVRAVRVRVAGLAHVLPGSGAVDCGVDGRGSPVVVAAETEGDEAGCQDGTVMPSQIPEPTISTLGDVVRTCVFLTRMEHWQGRPGTREAVRDDPAAMRFRAGGGFIDAAWLVEVEVDATLLRPAPEDTDLR